MNLQAVLAILQVVGFHNGFGRELPRFSDRHEPGPQPTGHDRRKDEAPGLNSHHQVDGLAVIEIYQQVRHIVQGPILLEQGGDVVKQNAFLGEIGNVTDQRFEVIHGGGLLNLRERKVKCAADYITVAGRVQVFLCGTICL